MITRTDPVIYVIYFSDPITTEPKSKKWVVSGSENRPLTHLESWFKKIENELQSKPQYNSVDVRKQLISAAKIVESFITSKKS